MTPDQTTPQDPVSQYEQPDTQGEQQTAPGSTAGMGEQPDHGEASYRGSGRLEGKRALITGGDSGIGRAVALAFAREGADVAVVHLPEEKADADATVALIRSAGRTGVAVAADLTEESTCRDVVASVVKQLGGLDVLVNNAAYQQEQPGGLPDITTEQFDRVMRTNLYATFWLSKFALPHLPEGGSILVTTSVQAASPSPGLLDYAMTKAALVAFVQALAQSVAERGIRVNGVAPGPIWTPLIPATMTEEKVASFGKSTPLGRAGQPAEVASAYVYLASQESSYVTGAVIPVTGGSPF